MTVQYSQRFNSVNVIYFVGLISAEFFDRFIKFLAFSCKALNYLQENDKKFKNRSKNSVDI